tara:strand:+ start:462 stop:788 length:327 start_codon:yes stop_codon:yes gene_type:complete
MSEDETSEKFYPPFIVNRCLSYFSDTVLYANEMNYHCSLDNKMQYEYFLNSVRKRKRFSRWQKNESSDDIDFIKEHFSYSDRKAKEALGVLGETGVKTLKERYTKGGR